MLAGQRLLRQAIGLADLLQQVFRQRAGIEPFVLLAGEFVFEAHPQPGAQHGLGLECVAQLGRREAVGVEEAGFGPEAHGGAGVLLADGADFLEL